MPPELNGGTFIRWLLSVLTLLIGLGVGGLWQLATKISAFEERIAAFQRHSDRSDVEITQRLDDLSRQLHQDEQLLYRLAPGGSR
jgi:hypothetical protein